MRRRDTAVSAPSRKAKLGSCGASLSSYATEIAGAVALVPRAWTDASPDASPSGDAWDAVGTHWQLRPPSGGRGRWFKSSRAQ